MRSRTKTILLIALASALLPPPAYCTDESEPKPAAVMLGLDGSETSVTLSGVNYPGVRIKKMEEGGIGKAAAMELGDILLSISGKQLASIEQANQALMRSPTGEIEIAFFHNNQLVVKSIRFTNTTLRSTQKIIVRRPDADMPNVAAQIVELINKQRANNNLPPLASSEKLTRLALSIAQDMLARDYFGQVDPDGKTMQDKAKRMGIPSPQAQSMISGVLTAEETVEEFMNDPPDAPNSGRMNILKPDFRSMGVGVAQKPSGVLIVVLEFAKLAGF